MAASNLSLADAGSDAVNALHLFKRTPSRIARYGIRRIFRAQ